jgi:hypothetical protein
MRWALLAIVWLGTIGAGVALANGLMKWQF